MRIQTNIMAFNAYRNLNTTNDRLASSLEKLSSGYRINRAADDASGLVISQNLDKQVSGLKVATQNAQDGISVVQTAEGALTQVNSMLQRIHDLIVQSANTASSDSTARSAAQNEIVQLRDEIDRIGNTTAFGNQNLLDGSFGAQEAKLTSTATGLTTGVTLTGTTADVQFSLNLDAGNTAGSLVTTVSVNAGTYATAASFQAELQTDVNTADQRGRRLHRRRHGQGHRPRLGRLDRRLQAQQHRRRHRHRDQRRRYRHCSGHHRQRHGHSGQHRRWRVPGRRQRDVCEPDSRVDRRRPHHQRYEHHVHRAGEHRRHGHDPERHFGEPRRLGHLVGVGASGQARCGPEPVPVHDCEPAGHHGKPLRFGEPHP